MYSTRVNYPILVPRAMKIETRSSIPALKGFELSSKVDVNNAVSVIKFCNLAFVNGGSVSGNLPIPGFKMAFGEQNAKRAFYLCMSDNSHSFLPVSENGFNVLVASTLMRFWFSEFMSTGCIYRTLIMDLVNSDSYDTVVSTADKEKVKNQRSKKLSKLFENEGAISGLDSLLCNLRDKLAISSQVPIDDDLTLLVSNIVETAEKIQAKVIKERSEVISTNDPVVLAAFYIGHYARMMSGIFNQSVNVVENEVTEITTLPFILDESASESVISLFLAKKREQVQQKLRESISGVDIRDIVQFNPDFLNLGFTPQARVVLTEAVTAKIAEAMADLMLTTVDAEYFRSNIDSYLETRLIRCLRDKKNLDESERRLLPLFFHVGADPLTSEKIRSFSFKDYDLAQKESSYSEDFVKFVNEFSDFIASITIDNPTVDSIFGIETVTAIDGPIEKIVRVVIHKRVHGDTYLCQSRTYLGSVPSLHYRHITLPSLVYSEKSVRIKGVNMMDRLGEGEVTQSNYSVAFEGDVTEFRQFIKSLYTSFTVTLLDELNGYGNIKLRTSAFTVFPNWTYKGLYIGNFKKTTDKFAVEKIDCDQCDPVELLFAFGSEVLGRTDLDKIYESRLRHLRDETFAPNGIRRATFSDYSTQKRVFNSISYYLALRKMGDSKDLQSSYIENVLSKFMNLDRASQVTSVSSNRLPHRTKLDLNNREYILFIPSFFLRQSDSQLLATYVDHVIKGPISKQTGKPYWEISHIKESDKIPDNVVGSPTEEYVKLTLRVDKHNLSFGSRTVLKLGDGVYSSSLEFADPDITDFVKRGRTIVYDDDGIKEAKNLFSNYWTIFRSFANGDNVFDQERAGRTALILNITAAILKDCVLRFYNPWNAEDLDFTEIYSSLQESVSAVTSYLKKRFDSQVYLADLGCQALGTVGSLVGELEKVDCSKLLPGTEATDAQSSIEAVTAAVKEISGVDIIALSHMEMCACINPLPRDCSIIKDLCDLTKSEIFYLPAPKGVDNVFFQGLDSYIGDNQAEVITRAVLQNLNAYEFQTLDD